MVIKIFGVYLCICVWKDCIYIIYLYEGGVRHFGSSPSRFLNPIDASETRRHLLSWERSFLNPLCLFLPLVLSKFPLSFRQVSLYTSVCVLLCLLEFWTNGGNNLPRHLYGLLFLDVQLSSMHCTVGCNVCLTIGRLFVGGLKAVLASGKKELLSISLSFSSSHSSPSTFILSAVYSCCVRMDLILSNPVVYSVAGIYLACFQEL